jgi:hypothetical protein
MNVNCIGFRERGTENCTYYVGFEVFTAVSMKMAVFWIVAPCSLVELYQGNRPDDGGSKDL